MPEARAVALVAWRELREVRRNRWFLLFSAVFAAGALGLSWLSMAGSGFAGFGRTAASLVNLVLLVVPLMGLLLAAGAVAGERERGSLLYLLSQPLEPEEVVLGKFLGLSAAVGAALLAGFGGAALVLAVRGAAGSPAGFLAFLALAGLLAGAAVGLGLLVSVLARRTSVALGTALFFWVLFVFVGDLGLLGTALALELGPRELLFAALGNPLQVFKVAALHQLRGGLEVLGPAGLYAERTFGLALGPLMAALLAAWTVVPLAAALVVLRRRGAVG